MSSTTPGRLSVTKVAEVTGLTPRAVRYYHSIGLVPEPPRDASGYRRYGGKEVIELVRVARLRALGMPLPQIAERVSAADAEDVSLAEALDLLADELDAEIDQMVSTRDRLRELARSETFDQPVKTLTLALQDQGVLGPADNLRSSEKWAAALLDAVHPDGMSGVLAEASKLFGNAAVMEALGPLRQRLGRLNGRSSEGEIAALAADVAGVLTSGHVDGQVDVGLFELLLTDRLNPIQQRFMRQLRAHMQVTPVVKDAE
ncbi:MerR family DNA-binding transcriptional regulator [Jatrophihabitans sp.]|uniref:helix-turn-helix domain-containing protein n=1 Tax=Jatrophihabitans sp. TaxID=1932789 RepID=UPI0030C6D940|nr:MerR family transcriptional regulator [Jatrophihabitans sp.]